MADRKLRNQNNEAESLETLINDPKLSNMERLALFFKLTKVETDLKPSDIGNLAYMYLDELLGLTDPYSTTLASNYDGGKAPELRELADKYHWIRELENWLVHSTMPRADAMYSMLRLPRMFMAVKDTWGVQRRIVIRLNIADEIVQLLAKWFDLNNDLETLEKIVVELEEPHSITEAQLVISRGRSCNDQILEACRKLLGVSPVFSQDEAILRKSPIMKFIAERDREAEEILRSVIQTRQTLFEHAPKLHDLKSPLKLTEGLFPFELYLQCSSVCKDEVRAHQVYMG